MTANRAIVVTEFGANDVLSIKRLSMPRYGDDQVLIEVMYAGLNPIDAKTRSGIGWAATKISSRPSRILGMEFSGRVRAVGGDVVGFRAGDAVLGWSGFPENEGAYQQYIAVDPSMIVSRPKTIGPSVASSIPVAGLTAWQAAEKVRSTLGTLAAQRVLVIGASGGCGHVTVQILKAFGSHVTGICSQRRASFLASLGVEEIIEYDQINHCPHYQYDAVIDFVGINRAMEYVPHVKKGGYWLTIPTISSLETINYAERHGLIGEGMLVRLNKPEVNKVVDLVSSGEVNLVVDRIFQLDQVRQAHDYMEANAGLGKAALRMWPEGEYDC